MTTPTAASTALLTEHFGWTPLMFIDDIINTVNAIANATVSSVETFLFSQRPELLGFKTPPGQTREVDEDGQTLFTEQEEDELRQGVHKLETLMDNAVDTTFDKFEIFLMRNVLVVKESLVGWCRLAHYKDIDFSGFIPSSSSSEPPVDSMDLSSPPPPGSAETAALLALRQRLFASTHLSLSLQAEKAENALVLSKLRELASSLSPSYTGPVTSFSLLQGSGKLKEGAEFALSQVGAVRERYEELGPRLEELKKVKEKEASKEKESMDGAEAYTERGVYLETFKKAQMEALRRERRRVFYGQQERGVERGEEEVRKLGEIVGMMGGRSDLSHGEFWNG
ncbi:Similar to Kinetochore-associated protein MTW1; acc. no. P39731 [Pyronema omphalodes CBS 100304]|uniref:Similar to Kinetochore-associated protein MTW1 acc. no. P39731 n=1 Tax=Pyronema omphalodes (strain CBS 100304) TaxID=1076935 RepID=U4L7J4_PYROM|nr:Similar to Kinetochore-associated protein MTW1; acc. no. P39731 [Pyronema omphalodes CBS 100304]